MPVMPSILIFLKIYVFEKGREDLYAACLTGKTLFAEEAVTILFKKT